MKKATVWPLLAFPLLGLTVFGLLNVAEHPTTSSRATVTAAPLAPHLTEPAADAVNAVNAVTAVTTRNTAKSIAQRTTLTVQPAHPTTPPPPRPTTANPAGEAPATKGEIALFFSANNMGELVDCGCHRNPLGGLARRVKWVTERAKRYTAAGHVDCGGALVADAGLSTDGPGEAESRAAVYFAGLHAAKTLALNVAPAELAVGADVLRRQAKRHAITLLATNTVGVRDGKALFKPWIIRTIGGLRVGFLGLTTKRPARRRALYTQQGMALTPPVDAAQAAVKALRGKVDAIVALSWLTKAEIDDLGEKVPEIDFVLGAKESDLTMRPEFLGRGYRLDCYNKGKWIGELRLHAGHGADGRWFDPELPDRLTYDQGSAQRQIAYYLKKHAEEDRAGGAKDARTRRFEVERLVGLRAKLARVTLELQGKISGPDGAARFTAKMHPMRTSLPEDAAITHLVEAHHVKFPPPPRP